MSSGRHHLPDRRRQGRQDGVADPEQLRGVRRGSVRTAWVSAQNRGELFSLEKGHPNAYAPGKRPFHTIIPAFVTKDGRALSELRRDGRCQQPQGQVQILINLIDFG